ncbi:MAG: DUF1778 domain-containing protein [Symploca sp. SIO2E6]|nr:DUF1778 domain-containing protein [Symploca sp. SIO2E6]
MSISSPSPTTTVKITLSQDRKTILETAANREGLSLSEYLLKIATEIAEQSMGQTESITLSEKDWDIVTSAITDPPELNEALKTAITRYKKQGLE